MFLISIRQNKILKRRASAIADEAIALINLLLRRASILGQEAASDSCRRWVCFDEDKGIRAIAYWQGCKNVTRRLAIADAQYATL